MPKVKAATLIEDMDFYPRQTIDRTHISHMVDAMNSGMEMPVIIVDKKSKRVVDGIHRRRATLKIGGPDAEIEVMWKTYRTEGDLFLDAMAYNAKHGKNLNTWDRMKCFERAAELGIANKLVSRALNLEVKRLSEIIEDRSCFIVENRNGKKKRNVPIKNTIRHMRGKQITKKQVEANEKLGGLNQMFYCNQIILLLEADLIDKENGPLIERLEHLYGALGKFVG